MKMTTKNNLNRTLSDSVKSSIVLALLCFTGYALAETEDSQWEASGSLILTYQDINSNSIDDEFQSSADLFIVKQSESSGWTTHFEITTSSRNNAISGKLVEANADAGSALDKDNNGRLQLSEVYYQLGTENNQSWVFGLVDVSGFFEQSRIASDETTQFLGASFVGNPTIEYPDYTLGVVYEQPIENGITIRAALAGSNGISDNAERSYSQLLSVADSHKGAFAVTSVSWKSELWLLRTGGWINTADHTTVKGDKNNIENYGGYFLFGYKQNNHALNFRLGMANKEVSRAATFTSVAYQFEHHNTTLGLGMARSFLSSEEVNSLLGDVTQYEIYLRQKLSSKFFLTADFQIIDNSDFGVEDLTRDQSLEVWGIRTSYLFD